VGGGFLHVAQRDPGVEGGGDERVPERVRADGLLIPARRATLRTIRPAPCRSSRRPSAARNTGPSVRSPMARSIARAVRGASGMVTTLPPLRVIVRVRWPALQAQVLDVGAGGLRDPQPVQREQEISACSAAAEPGGDQQGAELVAVQGGGVGLVVQPRPADVRGRGVVEEFFLDGVLVEPGDGAQPPGDGGAGPALGLPGRGRRTSMSARRTANRARERARHQVVNWRRSSA
jgi:hypothetical protein